MRPQPAVAIFSARKSPSAPKPPVIDVGAVTTENRSLLGRYHRSARARPCGHVEHKFAGVLGRAHHPDRRGRFD